MALKEVSDNSFKADVLDASRPVLVDFWAPWCGPCRMLGPILEALEPAVQGRVDIVKMNIDENPESAARFGVRSIPTMVLFKDGQALSTQVGVKQQAAIQQWLDSSI
jgi:thioredoxin 1